MRIPTLSCQKLSPSAQLYSVLFLASIGLFIAGTSVGWSSPASSILQNSSRRNGIPLTNKELRWFVSLFDVGLMLSPYPASYVMDRWGRSYLIFASAPIALLGWSLTLTYFFDTVMCLFLGRFIQGLSTGIFYLVLPVYACELAPPQARSVSCTITSGMHSAGILFSYVIGHMWSFNTLNLLCVITSALYLFVVFYLPETPYYFLMQGNEPEALRVCMCFDECFSDTRFQHMKVCVQDEMGRSVFRDIFMNRSHPFIIVMMLGIALRFIFFWNTPSHAKFIFKFGDSQFSEGRYSTVFALLLFLAITSTFLIVRRVGRRKTTMLAQSLTVIFAFPIACLFHLKDEHLLSRWCGFVLVSLIVFCANLGLAPMPIVQQTEFFPTNCRALAGALLITVSTVSGWIAGSMFVKILNSIGSYCDYIVSGTVAAFAFLITWRLLPEVKGVSLHDIQLNVKYPPTKQRVRGLSLVMLTEK